MEKESMEIEVPEHLEELNEIKQILKELERTAETNGCYCPFNKTFPWQAKIVHKVREILRAEIEN